MAKGRIGRSMITYRTTIPFCRSIASSSFKAGNLTNKESIG
ncbi:MAG: hypothetical protein WC157_00100 [Candidatus Paceibacterota bacterium]